MTKKEMAAKILDAIEYFEAMRITGGDIHQGLVDCWITLTGDARGPVTERQKQLARVRATGLKVSALRPDLAAGDAIATVLAVEPWLTAEQVIETLDEAARDFAQEPE